MKPEDYQLVYNEANSYLLDLIDKKTLEKYLKLGEAREPTSLNDTYRGLLSSLTNKRNMSNSIGPIENLSQYLFDFDSKKIYKQYLDDWERLFKDIEKSFEPPTKMDVTNSKSYWVHFVKGIIDSARFFSDFKNLEEFDAYVQTFYQNDLTRPALPMILAKEVHGLGFATACDFLKENGYPEYVKPDVHIKDIFNGLEITSTRNDYEVFKSVIRFSRTVKKSPYEVDKLFWLIGSGKFYLDNIKVKTNKQDFIAKVKTKIST